MEHRFESHGLTFIISGDGFLKANAENDFHSIAEQTEAKLDAMPAAEVARLHAGCLAATDSAEAIELDDIAGRVKTAVTKDWRNPNGAMVSLVAWP